VIPLLAVGWFAYNAVPTGFMPAVDEGGFILDYYTPAGTSLTEHSREIAEVERLAEGYPELRHAHAVFGTGLGGDLGESYHGDYFVRLKPDHARSTPEVMAFRAGSGAVACTGHPDRAGTVDGGSDRRSDGGTHADRDKTLRFGPIRADPTSGEVVIHLSRPDCLTQDRPHRARRCADHAEAAGRPA